PAPELCGRPVERSDPSLRRVPADQPTPSSLDDEQRSGRAVVGEDIDDPALAIDRERLLGDDFRVRQSLEKTCAHVVQQSVAEVDLSLQVGPVPPNDRRKFRVERVGNLFDRAERDGLQAIALNSADPPSRNPTRACQIGLTPVTAEAQRSDRNADAGRLHGPRMATAAYFSLI